MAIVVESSIIPCSTYTSDRDPRVCLNLTVSVAEFSREGSSYCFWSRSEAEQFLALAENGVRERHTGILSRIPHVDASAFRLTTQEIMWLCTPLDETPAEICKRPASMPDQEVVD